MFLGVVSNRRILARRNDASASTAFQHGSGNPNGGRSGRKRIAKSFFGSGLQRFPFFSSRECDHAPATHVTRWVGGENPVFEVQRSFPFGVQRMHGDETEVPLVVKEDCRDWMVDRPRRMNSRRESP